MRATASQELIDLLTRLELATAADLRRAARRARRLAGDLTHFDSVWVDALVQAEKLTPYQAAEINAGRGPGLRVGHHALLAPLGGPVWAHSYEACTVDTAASRHSRLVAVTGLENATDVVASMSDTIRKLSGCTLPQITPITGCGADGATLWATSPPIAGRPAAEWLVHAGRMPPEVVLEIARQMAIGLLALERVGVAHGDISTHNLVLDPIGLAQLTWPGLRSAVRPNEATDTADWPAAAYDHPAPERMRGAPASATADIYSCGAVWRHLLAGRSPFAQARAEVKLCAAQTQKLEPITHVAPDTPPALARAIIACESRDVSQRPANAAALVELLGPSTDHGRALVAQYLSRGATQSQRLARSLRKIRRSSQLGTWIAVAAGVVFALAVGSASWWAGRMIRSPAIPAAAPQVAFVAPDKSKLAQKSRSDSKGSAPTQNAVTPPPPTSKLPNPLAPTSEGAVSRSTAKRQPEPTDHVTPTSATQPIRPASTRLNSPPKLPRETARTVSKEFLLAAARPTAWSSVQPLAGQTVKGRAGERPTVIIPTAGAVLSAEGVHFEQINFVAPPGARVANLRVTARSASFEDCTFGGAALDDGEGVSLVWTPRVAEESPAAPAELLVTGGAIRSAAGALRCATSDESILTLNDVLHLGAGPLICVESALPQNAAAAPASLVLRLTHCTSRGASSLLEVAAPASAGQTPRVRVAAIECVFALASDGTLLLVCGGETPDDALRQLDWTGQGSVVTPGAQPVAWQAAGDLQPVADNRLAIEGLVRSELGFAGEPDAGREASQLVRWQVPLRSPNPPGITDAAVRTPRKPLR